MKLNIEFDSAKVEKAFNDKNKVIGVFVTVLILDKDISKLSSPIKESAENVRSK